MNLGKLTIFMLYTVGVEKVFIDLYSGLIDTEW